MWFAGLSRDYADPWMLPLVARLLQNDRATLGLMGPNPFPDRPPTFIRARSYEYRFTIAAGAQADGRVVGPDGSAPNIRRRSFQNPALLDVLHSQGWCISPPFDM